MKTFEFRHAVSVEDAIEAAAGGAQYFAGGTNLLDLMKTGVQEPAALIDVGRLGLRTVERTAAGGVLIGAGVTNSALANDPLIRQDYPMLSQAILSGATTQIRNMATVGGNLMQRTRCPYFMDPAFDQCNKRVPGSGCTARAGFNREHALFGASAECVAVHPSDMAVALVALDAVVHVVGAGGATAIPINDFFVLPGVHPERDTALDGTELIIAVELPAPSYATHSWYLKVRDRHSYAFALVSVAAGLEIDDGVVESAAIVLGGVAAKPWRLPAVSGVLAGKHPSATAFRDAARIAADGASPLSQNGFKVELVVNSVFRALQSAAARA